MVHLIEPYGSDGAFRHQLALDEGWPRRWVTTWLFDGDQVVWPVRNIESVPVLATQPMRRFTWRARQMHRPGLEFMVSTGRQHGFESLEERRLLLALDFLQVSEVLPQPFLLDFEHASGRAAHVPDFLALMPGGSRWLLDVRPGHLIKDDDALKFAATREVAAAAGWRYAVVTGWRPNVMSLLDALSARRRPAADPLGLQPQLLETATGGSMSFLDLVESTQWPALARAQAIRLLWQRRLGMSMDEPLQDGSRIWLGNVVARHQEGRA
ncbi:TnsA-like heteromeric transposase endonuclease subunit [Kitasatospora sp. NPDC002965]|uniref:TnsA-like heteromeric transposase endonuclease subunit n=1 Tax=Kitasatospora sp. NPDC002965 TaxID=3154775 RepID=UPI0033AA11C8